MSDPLTDDELAEISIGAMTADPLRGHYDQNVFVPFHRGVLERLVAEVGRLRSEVAELRHYEDLVTLYGKATDEWMEKAAHEISREQPSPDSLDWQETLVILRKHRDGKGFTRPVRG